jgi:quinol monooxygenase YgiN
LARARARPGATSRYLAAFADLDARLRLSPGRNAVSVYVGRSDPEDLLVLAEWADRGAMDAAMAALPRDIVARVGETVVGGALAPIESYRTVRRIQNYARRTLQTTAGLVEVAAADAPAYLEWAAALQRETTVWPDIAGTHLLVREGRESELLALASYSDPEGFHRMRRRIEAHPPPVKILAVSLFDGVPVFAWSRWDAVDQSAGR